VIPGIFSARKSIPEARPQKNLQFDESFFHNYLINSLIDEMTIMKSVRALGNERRMQILEWLKQPERHFPPQRDGDLVKDGVCGLLIARKLRVSQPAVTQHLKILSQAGFLRSKRTRKWTFYKRDEKAIKAIRDAISKTL
jgi:DNA-binding transcriptional ArsR family regulator